jgi:4-hydroxy-tetrahydrodipicolinate synthase
VDGIQVILPYYFIPTEEGMYEHYKAVVEAVNIGVIVYNNPAFAGSWVNPKLMKKMIDDFGGDGKIASVKENTPHLMLFNSMVKELKDTGVSIHSGFGEQWYAYQFPWGADGLATPFGNFYPEYPINIYKAAKKYDFEEMRKELEKMEPYYEFVARCSAKRKDTGILGKPGGAIYGEGNVRFGVIKEAMRIVGLNGGYMRKPLTNLEDSERDELKEVLKGIGIV